MVPYRSAVIKTDYSGYFSISFDPPRFMGLSVPLSETTPAGKEKKPRSPRGSSGLTSHAKRLLVGAVNLLETKYGKQNLVFHTGTLPSDSPAVKEMALRNSKQILKYWRKVLSRLLDRVGLPKDDIVIVLELQKRGAIHLHSVFVNRYQCGRYTLSLEQLDGAWRQALTAVIPALKTADFSAACNCERIKKSAGRYLAKYLSKGTKVQLDFSVTWYSIGDALKQRLKDLTKTVTTTIRDDFNFECLAKTIAGSKLGWCLNFFSLHGLEIRSLYGYFDYRQLDFAHTLLQWVSWVNDWTGDWLT